MLSVLVASLRLFQSRSGLVLRVLSIEEIGLGEPSLFSKFRKTLTNTFRFFPCCIPLATTQAIDGKQDDPLQSQRNLSDDDGVCHGLDCPHWTRPIGITKDTTAANSKATFPTAYEKHGGECWMRRLGVSVSIF